MKKRLLAWTLLLVMVVGLFAGCTTNDQPETKATENNGTEVNNNPKQTDPKEEELEPVTLRWYYPWEGGEGTEDVIEAFNAKLAEVLPNTTVEFIIDTSYNSNWSLYVASEEPIDIGWIGGGTFKQDAIDGNILDLSEYIEKCAPNLKSEMGIWADAYLSCTLDGGVYGIPCIQPVVKESGQFLYRDWFAEYLDIEALAKELQSNAKMTTKAWDIIEAGIQAAVDAGAYNPGEMSWYLESLQEAGKLGYLLLGDESHQIYFDPEAENPVPLFYWEIPEYQEAARRVAKFCEYGWITETQQMGQLPADAQYVIGFSPFLNANWADCDENGVKPLTADGLMTMMTNKPTDGYYGCSVFGNQGSYCIIPATCKNPERAVMLLDILHGGEGTVGYELINMLCYGFEKNSEEAKTYGWYNYVAEEVDGQLQVVYEEGVTNKHTLYNWALANTFKVMHDGGSLTTVGAKAYAMSYSEDVYPYLNETPISGIIIEYGNIASELEMIKTVRSEYNAQLCYGGSSVDKTDEVFATAIAKLYAAGFDKIKAELQAQIDAYMK